MTTAQNPTKVCNYCETEKSVDDFYRVGGRPAHYCKKCYGKSKKPSKRREPDPLRECHYCHQVKPLDDFYWQWKQNVPGVKVYHRRCKACTALHALQRRRRNSVNADKPVPERKRCYKCGNTKTAAEFYPNRTKDDGLHSECKECTKESVRVRKFRLACGVEMDDEAYKAMLEAQNGRCAICRDTPNRKALAVDHSHKTKTVRALLCERCNRGLGLFRDSPRLLKLAAAYLKKYQ